MSFSVKIAKSRGMCAGVERAIQTVKNAILKFPDQEIFVLHEVVHNKHVVDDLRSIGAHFVDSLEEVPDNSVLIFSAHGVGISTFNAAKARNLTIIDATCPVVSVIHKKMNKAGLKGMDAVVIGHMGHQEVVGTIGQYTGDQSKVHVIIKADDVESLDIDAENSMFATQTTLSIDETRLTVEALKRKYPNIQGPREDDTCRATQVRQNAVKELARECELVLIAGSANSSNSNRLKEVALNEGAFAYLIDDSSQIEISWFNNITTVGLSAGASAPQYVVDEIVEYLKQNGASSVEEVGSDLKEKSFPLPQEVQI
ncbi:MAG: 4-hydroxy-3-methylbut-2-enyl diphosphate reductase [Succinivibrio sp.]|nr:4-hydroxy-3-methylbut-2-enyl diphosphate reductase [Succinivibrio sp.]